LCRLIVSANDVAALLREVSPPNDLATYGKLLTLEMALSGVIASLSTKLRLTNQSRYATRTAERQSVKARTKPWTIVEGGKSGGNLAPVSADADADGYDEGAWN
jgi:hypothetical protein